MRRPLVSRFFPALAALFACVACGGGARSLETAPRGDACRATLAPRAEGAPNPASTMPAFVAARSTLVVNVEVPLAAVKQALEAKVPQRVAEERDQDIGIAGRLEYTVDRGPFAVSVQGDALVLEAPLQAHARACAKGSCYSGCDPEARVSARVPLKLGADYKFRPSQVRIDVTRGCEIRALGGFVRINLTPVVQGRLAQETKRIEASIDRELPDLRPQALRLWADLSRPRPLALGACVVLAPEAIVQGPASGTGDLARLRFGLLARPEMRVRCGEAPKASPLPKLADDGALGDVGDMHLAIVLPPEAPAIALDGAVDPLDLGRGPARIRGVSGPPSALAVDIEGDVCGAAYLAAGGAAWAEDGRTVQLTGLASLAGDRERLASAGLDPAPLAKAIERTPIAVPLAKDELKTVLPDLARGLSDERVVVSASVTDARPEAAGLRGGEVIAVLRVRGAVTLRAK